jgi:IS30 family transposase
MTISPSVPVVTKTKEFSQLSDSECAEIAILYNKNKYSLRDIALALTRNVSTISREIKNNSVRNKQTGLMEYVAKKARHKRYARRKYCKITLKKIKEYPTLEKYIREKILTSEWSPETISVMWKLDHPESDISISWKTIYQYCYSAW